MRRIYSVFLGLLILASCAKDNNKFNVDVTNINGDFKLARFDIDFYSTTEATLPKLKEQYRILFPHDNDSIWISKINNKEEQELFLETQKVFKDLSLQEKQLENLFKHVAYYNPNFLPPTVITMLTNIDYDNRVLYNQEYLLISLDVYLGSTHEFYGDYPGYVKLNNHKDHLIVDAANAIINVQMPPNRERNFISKMIYEGKKMYLLDSYLPGLSDREKIGYAEEKITWAESSEDYIWKYFIEKELLFSTDSKLNQRFLDAAPFSKFYLGEDNLSPGRIGVWVGWQIVRSYMQKNDVSLSELLQTDEEKIFKESKYKPKK
ncbi:gliding motility lipoprotein GldB [Tenacibaculum sp. M341]|uniref:gliding motility lipoprotein GldB n=1 Tax=Tenacibaculum sp. M341 TaxID=2530339 RepID=UPI00104E8153|nr:gliding motility lipoprotein GldB [Tenacibaculum sp. M341]TCI94334.1 gliding motility lipoprotein GldB [Tenacibaculum sp. M341]